MPNRLRKDGLGSVRSIQPNSGASSTPKEDEQRREHRDVQSTRAEQSEVRAVALNDGPPKHRQKHEPRERGNGDRACEVSQGGCRGRQRFVGLFCKRCHRWLSLLVGCHELRSRQHQRQRGSRP